MADHRTCLAILCFGCLSSVAGCEARVEATRVWTPQDHTQPSRADPSRVPAEQRDPEPVSKAEAQARAARALWNVTCASCHGQSGRGQGAARPPGAQIPDFSSEEWQSSRTDAALRQTIVEGRGLMPAFGKRVNDDGVDALIGHMRSLAR